MSRSLTLCYFRSDTEATAYLALDNDSGRSQLGRMRVPGTAVAICPRSELMKYGVDVPVAALAECRRAADLTPMPGRGLNRDCRSAKGNRSADDRLLAFVRAYGAANDGDFDSCLAWLRHWAASEAGCDRHI